MGSGGTSGLPPAEHVPDGGALDEIALRLAEVAVAAGQRIAEVYARGFSPMRKADASPVTEADLLAEDLIVPRLGGSFPGVPVVAEELVAAGHVPALGNRFLLVDPLDGTREFVAHRHEFTVNLALVEGGRPVAGAIYAPLLQRLWFAGERSRTIEIAPGANLGRATAARCIAVREPPASGLVALVSRSHLDPATEAYLARLPVAESRPMGSSLKFCLIAQGEADLYPRLAPTCEWDTAAGHAILVAAGGTVTTPDGACLRYGKARTGFRHQGFVAWGGARAGEARA